MPPNVRHELASFDQFELEQLSGLIALQGKAGDAVPTSEQVAPPPRPANHAMELTDDEIATNDEWENVVDLEAAATATEFSDNYMKPASAEPHNFSNHPDVKEYIRRQSTCLSSRHRYAAVLDQARLAQATKDAGFYAFGIMGVEVWVMDEDTGQLERPNGGWWGSEFLEYTSPILSESSDDKESIPTCIPRWSGRCTLGRKWRYHGSTKPRNIA